MMKSGVMFFVIVAMAVFLALISFSHFSVNGQSVAKDDSAQLTTSGSVQSAQNVLTGSAIYKFKDFSCSDSPVDVEKLLNEVEKWLADNKVEDYQWQMAAGGFRYHLTIRYKK